MSTDTSSGLRMRAWMRPRGTVHGDVAGWRAAATVQQGGDAARAVAALLDLEPVGVEDAVEHGRSCPARRFEHQRLVEADAGMAVRQLAPVLRRGQRAAGRRIEDDEVVAEAVHLREVDAHDAEEYPKRDFMNNAHP